MPLDGKALAKALDDLCTQERLCFACLLITDINTQNSLLVMKGDADFIRKISYAHVEQDEIFDLPGVVSRKKQLIPYLTGLLRDELGSARLANLGARRLLVLAPHVAGIGERDDAHRIAHPADGLDLGRQLRDGGHRHRSAAAVTYRQRIV